MQDVGGLLGRAEGLRVWRAERHQFRVETVPDAGIGKCGLQRLGVEAGDALQKRKRRHVHQGEAGPLRRGDLDQKRADRVNHILRLLHGENHEIVALGIDGFRHLRIQTAGQILREERAMLGLVLQLQPDLGALLD